MKHALLVALLLVGCAKHPTVSFYVEQCSSAPMTETRTRRIQTTCAMRSGSANTSNSAKICLMWNHATIRKTIRDSMSAR